MPHRAPITLLLAFGFATLGAPAAAALTFTANLDSIKATVAPGQVLDRYLQLKLGDDEGARFRAAMKDWWQSEDGSQSFYRPPGTLQSSCAPWVAVDPVESQVAAGKALTVRLSIRVPRDIAPGGYWCVLTLEQLRDPLAEPEGVRIRFLSSIAVGVFLEVAPVSRRAAIAEIALDGDRVLVTLRNLGDVPLGAEGWIELTPAERGLAPIKVLLPRVTVLTEPIRQRQLVGALPPPAELPSGAYHARVILDIGLDHYIGVERKVEIHRGPAG